MSTDCSNASKQLNFYIFHLFAFYSTVTLVSFEAT